jgi:hypothetical protein
LKGPNWKRCDVLEARPFYLQGLVFPVVVQTSSRYLQAWHEELAAEAKAEAEYCGLHRADNTLIKPKEGFDRWKSNKIWLKNLRDENLIVYVDRIHTVRELIGGEITLGASPTSAQIAAHLELQRMAGRVQIEKMTPGQPRKLFELGSRPGGAFVTAVLESDRRRLLCMDKVVPGGHVLELAGEPFDHPLLAPNGS